MQESNTLGSFGRSSAAWLILLFVRLSLRVATPWLSKPSFIRQRRSANPNVFCFIMLSTMGHKKSRLKNQTAFVFDLAPTLRVIGQLVFGKRERFTNDWFFNLTTSNQADRNSAANDLAVFDDADLLQVLLELSL